jgi:hypothetical protein
MLSVGIYTCEPIVSFLSSLIISERRGLLSSFIIEGKGNYLTNENLSVVVFLEGIWGSLNLYVQEIFLSFFIYRRKGGFCRFFYFFRNRKQSVVVSLEGIKTFCFFITWDFLSSYSIFMKRAINQSSYTVLNDGYAFFSNFTVFFLRLGKEHGEWGSRTTVECESYIYEVEGWKGGECVRNDLEDKWKINVRHTGPVYQVSQGTECYSVFFRNYKSVRIPI